MKIILIILCALLFKADAAAQTWRKISPESATGLKGMQAFEYGSRKFILAYNDTVLHISEDEGVTWAEKKSHLEQCVFPPYEPSRFNYHSVAPANEGILYITYEGFDCGSIDGSKMILIKTHLDSLHKDGHLMTALSVNLCHPYAHIANVKGKNNYVLYDSKIYYFENDISSLAHFSAPNSKEGGCGPDASRIFALDNRDTSTLYFSFVTYDSLWNKYDNLFKKRGGSGDWELRLTMPFENDNFSRNKIGAFRDIAFPDTDTSFIMIATNAGVHRFGKGVIDTVLKTPVNALAISPDENFVIAGGEDGKLYYTHNYGNTWVDNVSEGLASPILDVAIKSQTGVIELYALTENGIWEIALNLVSVQDFSNHHAEKLTITPNPANTSLKISFLKTESPQQLSIFNSLGQTVFKTEFSGEFTWDFKTEIPDGVYTIAVKSGSKGVAKQVVIMR
jgi:hypothetical protein